MRINSQKKKFLTHIFFYILSYINKYISYANKCADATVFVSSWIKDLYSDYEGINNKLSKVILSGADSDQFNNQGFKKIRKALEPTSAVKQCERALELTSGNVINKTCYLCGCAMLKWQSLECEHILPILPALTHLWIVRGSPNVKRDTGLAMEYAWTHECCNQWKSDAEFIAIQKTIKELNCSKEDISTILVKKVNHN